MTFLPPALAAACGPARALLRRSRELGRIGALLFAAAVSARAAKPNVLFIAVDDLRPELHCYGAAHMHTPHMDRLASEGRLFLHHYVAVPTCGASRYALMTSLRPTAATDDNAAFDHMPKQRPARPESWVDLLRRNGWHTVSLGKVTHEPDGFRWNYPTTYDLGRRYATYPDMRFSWDEILFDHGKWGAQRYPLFAYADGTGRVRNTSPAYEIGVDARGDSLPDDAYPDGRIAAAAVEKLREFADDGVPFCLAVGFFKPHLPFNAPKAYYDLYDPAALPGPDPATRPVGAEYATTIPSGEPNAYTALGDRARLRRAYFACVSYVDAQIGKVLDALDALGLADNTLVVLWGDHGWCLDDYGLLGKHVVLERVVHAPLIVRLPRSLGGDPFAGVPANGIVETIDLYPTLAELCGVTPPAGIFGESFVPLLRNPFAPGKDAAYSRWGAVTTVRSLQWRLIHCDSGNDLYDLSRDPYEREDIHAEHPDVVSRLTPALTRQAGRHGHTNYVTWAAERPELADPHADADGDGAANQVEYLAGANPLDAASRPEVTLEWLAPPGEDQSTKVPVFGFTVSTLPDDVRFRPLASPDLRHWSSSPLVFFDATPLDDGLVRLQFRFTQSASRQFFRLHVADD
jgi:arylsulfatase A-like enzyme